MGTMVLIVVGVAVFAIAVIVVDATRITAVVVWNSFEFIQTIQSDTIVSLHYLSTIMKAHFTLENTDYEVLERHHWEIVKQKCFIIFEANRDLVLQNFNIYWKN